jgi:hypothetical protein
MLDSWQRRPDSTIIDNYAISERHIEVNSQQHALAG